MLYALGRLLLVLEQCIDSHNHQAVLRTAEGRSASDVFLMKSMQRSLTCVHIIALGIQYVYVIDPNEKQVKNRDKVASKKVTKNCAFWLTIRHFPTITDCIQALKADGREIWATDLSNNAVPLELDNKHLFDMKDKKIAIVIGRETDGVSTEMLNAADMRVFFPIYGFSESLNLSVATALVFQRLFDWFPHIRGDLELHEKEAIRASWYQQLITNPTAAKNSQYWIENSHAIAELPDLRRERERTGAQNQNPWVSKKIRQREREFEQVQSRAKKSNVNGSETDASH